MGVVDLIGVAAGDRSMNGVDGCLVAVPGLRGVPRPRSLSDTRPGCGRLDDLGFSNRPNHTRGRSLATLTRIAESKAGAAS